MGPDLSCFDFADSGDEQESHEDVLKKHLQEEEQLRAEAKAKKKAIDKSDKPARRACEAEFAEALEQLAARHAKELSGVEDAAGAMAALAGPDLSCFDFGEEDEETPAPAPQPVAKAKGKGKGKAAQRAAKKVDEEAQRELRIAQAKAEPAGSVRKPGEPAALGDFVEWALEQQELASCSGPEGLLSALHVLAAVPPRGGKSSAPRWDERCRLEDLLLRFEQAEADYTNPVLAPRYRWRAAKTVLERHGHVETLRPSLRQQAGPCALLLGDSHFERLHRSASASAALPRGAAVHAVGGDGAEHLLMRLHLTWRGCLAHAHAQAYVLLVGINNLLGNMGETHTRRSKRASPAQVAAGLSRPSYYRAF